MIGFFIGYVLGVFCGAVTLALVAIGHSENKK
jgi:hypothetical protein